MKAWAVETAWVMQMWCPAETCIRKSLSNPSCVCADDLRLVQSFAFGFLIVLPIKNFNWRSSKLHKRLYLLGSTYDWIIPSFLLYGVPSLGDPYMSSVSILGSLSLFPGLSATLWGRKCELFHMELFRPFTVMSALFRILKVTFYTCIIITYKQLQPSNNDSIFMKAMESRRWEPIHNFRRYGSAEVKRLRAIAALWSDKGWHCNIISWLWQ